MEAGIGMLPVILMPEAWEAGSGIFWNRDSIE